MAVKIADSLVPQWIREIGEDKKLKTTNQEEAGRYEALEKALLRSDGPALAKSVLKEFTLQTSACDRIGILAVMNSISRHTEEEAFRIEVSAKSPWPKNTYIDIHYVSGDRFIRCYPRDSASFALELVASKTGELVILHDGNVVTAEQAVTLILQPIAKSVA